MIRYPYTEAYDTLRALNGAEMSRADAAIAIQDAAKVLNISTNELTTMIADAGRYRSFMPQFVNAIRQFEEKVNV